MSAAVFGASQATHWTLQFANVGSPPSTSGRMWSYRNLPGTSRVPQTSQQPFDRSKACALVLRENSRLTIAPASA